MNIGINRTLKSALVRDLRIVTATINCPNGGINLSWQVPVAGGSLPDKPVTSTLFVIAIKKKVPAEAGTLLTPVVATLLKKA